jgi:hypothetical protein
MQKHWISIWFFIGALFVVYGVLVLGAGIYAAFNPEANPVVLGNLHIAIWWGAAMLLFGFFFVLKFWPKTSDRD